jgi:hypothetical protein
VRGAGPPRAAGWPSSGTRCDGRSARGPGGKPETTTVGVDIEQGNLEFSSPEEVLDKACELFRLARATVQQQFQEGRPTGPGRPNGNGNGRSYGRPEPEPTPRQKALLEKLARERGLGPEQVGDVCRRLLGRPVTALDRTDMSRLLDALMEEHVP